MVTKNLLTRMLLLFALVVGSVTSVWGEDALTIDFESTANTYTDWTITTIKTQQTNSDFTAHGGSYFGSTDGKTTGSMVTKEKIASPQSIVFYVSKQSTNTTASSWLIKVSEDGETWTQVGDAQSASVGITKGVWTEVIRDLSSYSDVYVGVFYDGTIAIRCIDDVKLTYSTGSSSAVATAVTIDDSGLTNTDIYGGREAGSLTASVKAGEATVEGATVTWTSSNEGVATINANGEVRLVAAGTTTIKASYAGVKDEYKPSSATYELTVVNTDPNAPGTENNPYTVAEVRNGTATGNGIYVIGYIVGSWSNNKFDPDNLVNTNLALADSPIETEGNKTIPVELKNSFRPNFGLTDGGKAYNIGVAQVLINGNAKSYFNVNGIKELNSIVKVAENVNISSAGMATYYTDCALDFTEFDDMYAYVATTEGTTINYKRVKKVPANTAVLLRNPNETSATHDVPVITEGAETVSGNQFEGTLTAIASLATDATDGSKNYILNNGTNGVGFYWANGQAVGVHRAYLNVPASTAPFFGFNEDEGTTGINPSMNLPEGERMWYDLSGRRVAQPTKGVFIKNGKKVLVP